MTGVRLTVETTGLDAVIERLDSLVQGAFRSDLLERMGSFTERAVHQRLDEDKTAPDGTPWAAWTDAYAKTRHGNQSLLVAGGPDYLLESIDYVVDTDGKSVRVGSNVEYAAIHQFGGGEQPAGTGRAGIPARPYLGLSDDDAAQLEGIVADWIDRKLRGGGSGPK